MNPENATCREVRDWIARDMGWVQGLDDSDPSEYQNNRATVWRRGDVTKRRHPCPPSLAAAELAMPVEWMRVGVIVDMEGGPSTYSAWRRDGMGELVLVPVSDDEHVPCAIYRLAAAVRLKMKEAAQ